MQTGAGASLATAVSALVTTSPGINPTHLYTLVSVPYMNSSDIDHKNQGSEAFQRDVPMTTNVRSN